MKYSSSHQHRFFPLFLLIPALYALSGAANAQQAVTLDRVVAIVDDGVVMLSELNEQMDMIEARLAQQPDTQVPPREVLLNQVLEHLIVQELQLQMAERAGVEVEPKELDDAIDEMRRNNNLSEEQFAEQLQHEGMTMEHLRDNVRKEILVNRVQRGVIGRRIKVTDHDVESFLNSKEGQFWTSPEYHLGHILIAVGSSAPEAEVAAAKQKADDIVAKLRAGADFAQMAITYSSGQNALNGGDLGWRKAEEMPELFASQLTNVAAGDIAGPFRSGAGFHILKVEEQRGGGERLVEQSKVRHILISPSEILTDEQARQKLIDLRQQVLDGKATFAELAKEYSEDIGSKQSGGDVGWSLPGQFVPEFEATIAKTTIGEISMPFRTQFGWHILTVEDRRKEDMSETVKHNQAMNLLYSRRFEEELPIWLQEIRDEAFVDIKLSNQISAGEDSSGSSQP